VNPIVDIFLLKDLYAIEAQLKGFQVFNGATGALPEILWKMVNEGC